PPPLSPLFPCTTLFRSPEVHALMAELVTAVEPRSSGGAMEALAARLLRPLDPLAWRRWAYIQIQSGQYQEAYVSLGRYVQLAGRSEEHTSELQSPDHLV